MITKELLVECLDQGMSLDQIAGRVDRAPSTVSYHLRKHELVAIGSEVHSPNRKVDPQRLTALIEDGATIREAAAQIGVGYSTIRHWVKKLNLETGRMKRLSETRRAMQAHETQPEMTCPKHGNVVFIRRGDGRYRCSKCRTEHVSNWRRRVKERLVDEAGGACRICGYSRNLSSLQFHHLDPTAKSFTISRNGVTRSFAEAKAEASGCVLLCANCHAEVEAGYTQVPIDPLSVELGSEP